MKSEKYFGCKNTVYPTKKVSVNGILYHKSCFKCCHGGCVISPSNYIAHEGRLYSETVDRVLAFCYHVYLSPIFKNLNVLRVISLRSDLQSELTELPSLENHRRRRDEGGGENGMMKCGYNCKCGHI
ncbi:pollen-specific protein SF3-like [Capsicum annuum]